ncbi:PQQ-dependent sugar dehydrogenase [uncultured Winogradskyella sp.]|uniref:PQQ-dependent sugar dehydrogenase n=1 Tax=uncultured Winogradskyella sp. TaxID=395353 RepID=UPI0026037D35|nr:PQQ-dependent sugar dehydrogenase [uncultured Winogradskyella sp.]
MTKKICFLTLILTCYTSFSQIQLDNTLVSERVIATNLTVPWDMTYSNDGWIWFTELSGNINRVNPDTNELQPIHSVPDVEVFGFSAGMHSIVLHPDFPTTPYLFVHYTNTATTSKLVRYTYGIDSNTLSSPLTIIDNIPGSVSHNGSRMLIENDKLFITIGDGYIDPTTAQDLSTLNGNILRLNLDGSIPADNPITNSYIWSFGHRNPQGLCSGNGKIYSSEHGTSNNDEINIIEENANFGWPNVEGYCDLSSEMAFCNNENVVEPIWAWTPAIAPCGMDYFDHPSIPEWQNSLLLAVLKDKKLIQLQLSADGNTVIEENSYLINTRGRLRDVLVLPDGRIFICTTNKDFAGTPNADDDKIIELKNNDFLSLETFNNNSFKVFPNPAKGFLTLKTNTNLSSNYTLEIVSINGRSVLRQSIYNRTTHININTLSSGIYILKVSNAESSSYKKIIVK